MLLEFGIGFGAAIVLVGGWYLWFRRIARWRSVQILGWIERAFSDYRAVRSVSWESDSSFRVELALPPSMFRRASLAVRLQPKEMPLNWLLSRMHALPETVTFEAELDQHPTSNLFLQKHQWRAGTRCVPRRTGERWQCGSLGPMVISTQPDPQQHFGAILELMLAARSGNFLYVMFRRKAPQFVACAPLSSLSPHAPHTGMFEVLRDLATIVSTSTQ
jgi:hypothetical protein